VLLQYRDLPADTYLCLSLYELCEGRPMLLVGSSSMPMFSKKGRLKTGQQRLQVRLFAAAAAAQYCAVLSQQSTYFAAAR
jgi:phosphatidylinositol 3-kinase